MIYSKILSNEKKMSGRIENDLVMLGRVALFICWQGNSRHAQRPGWGIPCWRPSHIQVVHQADDWQQIIPSFALIFASSVGTLNFSGINIFLLCCDVGKESNQLGYKQTEPMYTIRSGGKVEEKIDHVYDLNIHAHLS